MRSFILWLLALLGFDASIAQPVESPLYREGYIQRQFSLDRRALHIHTVLRNALPLPCDTLPSGVWRKSPKGKNNLLLELWPAAELSASLFSPDAAKTGGKFGGGLTAIVGYKKWLFGELRATAVQGGYQQYTRRVSLLSGVAPEGQPISVNASGIVHYTDINGYLNVQTGAYMQLGIGQGRQFIGEGYRSFFLSDYAGNMTYGHITATFWRLKYKVIYSHLRDMRSATSSRYSDMESKFSTSHYLSWNVNKWLNLGLFEAVVWRGRDTLLDRGFDVNYLNPVIFMRPTEFAQGSSDNSLVGAAINIRPTDDLFFYSQLMLDEFLLSALRNDAKHFLNPSDTTIQWGWWANKWALQVGVKQFGLLGWESLGIQSELNVCRPFTFSHSDPMSNYGHLNRSLAHPLGANFVEWLLMVHYVKERWFGEAGLILQQRGTDAPGINSGNDPYASYQYRQGDYRHYIGQAQTAYIQQWSARASWMAIPRAHLRLFAESRLRLQDLNNIAKQDFYFELGITSRFFERYLDN